MSDPVFSAHGKGAATGLRKKILAETASSGCDWSGLREFGMPYLAALRILY